MGCLLGILALGITQMNYNSAVLAQESITAECPTCKEKTVLRKGMGVMALKKEMVCPECKGKGTAHVCEKCGTEVIACPKCQKVIAVAEEEKITATCPSCGEKTTLKKGMGVMPLEKEMTCDTCKGKGTAHVCEKCGATVSACPMCGKVLTAQVKEEVQAVCPICKEKPTLKKGMGVMAVEKEMTCPDCKGKGTAHVCTKCGTAVIACPKCSKVLTP
jgi:DnaJ-class molecular chaperone